VTDASVSVPGEGNGSLHGWSGRNRERALLVLADGEVFEGEAVGALSPGGLIHGELEFNTVLSGYQEVVTDPSYDGQVVERHGHRFDVPVNKRRPLGWT
jgi:hypothetical protein